MSSSDIETWKLQPDFAIICVLGAPGAGKGTLCKHLAQNHNLVHHSIGDHLRSLVKQDPTAPLAVQIQDKLDNQGFLSPHDLNPLIGQAIRDALQSNDGTSAGVLLDGFPRCAEQSKSFDAWPVEYDPPSKTSGMHGHETSIRKPDIVLFLKAARETAEARYMGRGRDSNDNAEKFERRFREYESETIPVVEAYRQCGILIEVDANGTVEEMVRGLSRKLEASKSWQDLVASRSIRLGLVQQEYL